MGTFADNLRYAIRGFMKNPGFTIVAVLTLALGIGANTAIFSVVYAALLKPLPFRDATRLMTIGETRQQQQQTNGIANSSYPDFRDWTNTVKRSSSLAAWGGDAFTFTGSGEPKIVFPTQVTANFFATLGVTPVLGRDFRLEEQQTDGPHVAILSDAFWRSDFSADQSAIGRTIRLDNQAVTIVGVLPSNFDFAPRSAPIFVPLHPAGDLGARRNLRWLNVIGRLAPGATEQQARAEMETIRAQLAIAHPKEDASVVMVLGSLRERILGQIQPLLLILFGAVAFVLLIACANVANLFLTRSVGRRKEFAVRLAIGATRGDLLRQLLAESVLLSIIGAAVGLVAAYWAVDALIGALPDSQLKTMPYLTSVGINLPVLAFMAGVTLLTGILFGLAPGLAASRTSLNESLKEEARGGTGSAQTRLRNALVIAEIATSLVLLVGAGLMLESLHALLHRPPGFDLGHVLTFSVNLPDSDYPSEKQYPGNSVSAIRFEHAFTERLASLPGVAGVAMASGIPATGGNGTIRFVEEGRVIAQGQEDEADILTVNTSYFSALKIPLVSGRVFTAHDTLETPQLAIVNQTFAKSYFPNENPIGKRIRFTFNAKEPYREIVGVVGDTAEDDLAGAPPAVVYVANDQGSSTFLSYMIRTAGDPAAFVATARAALREMDPRLPLIQPQTLEQIADQSPSVFLRRYPSYLIGGFAGLALLLAMIGLYGLISYGVAQRTREIGIRIDARRAAWLRSAISAAAGIGCSAGWNLWWRGRRFRSYAVAEMCSIGSSTRGLVDLRQCVASAADRRDGSVVDSGATGDEGGSCNRASPAIVISDTSIREHRL